MAGRTGGADLADEQTESSGGVVEPHSRVLLGQAFDEDGTEGFVLALLRTRGLEEETLHKGIVHGRPEC